MEPISKKPKSVVFLALGEEALPLIKRGVIPLSAAHKTALIWFSGQRPAAKQAERISDNSYFQHLQREYQRLPENLQGLFSLEEFIRQAEPKRIEIEAALLARANEQRKVEQGQAQEWLLQRFWCNPYSALAWTQTGWDKLWLGFDLALWPDNSLQQVLYQTSLPAQFPERLLVENTELQSAQEQRLLLHRSQAAQWVTIAGQRQALLRYPHQAVHGVLFGSAVATSFIKKFAHYWRQDLRYKQKPLARMVLDPQQTRWSFEKL